MHIIYIFDFIHVIWIRYSFDTCHMNSIFIWYMSYEFDIQPYRHNTMTKFQNFFSKFLKSRHCLFTYSIRSSFHIFDLIQIIHIYDLMHVIFIFDATHCNSLEMWMYIVQFVAVFCSVLHCIAVCYSVLQSIAVCCIVLQCVTVCCSLLQCVWFDTIYSIRYIYSISHMSYEFDIQPYRYNAITKILKSQLSSRFT